MYMYIYSLSRLPVWARSKTVGGGEGQRLTPVTAVTEVTGVCDVRRSPSPAADNTCHQMTVCVLCTNRETAPILPFCFFGHTIDDSNSSPQSSYIVYLRCNYIYMYVEGGGGSSLTPSSHSCARTASAPAVSVGWAPSGIAPSRVVGLRRSNRLRKPSSGLGRASL